MALEVGSEVEAKLAVADPAILRALARRPEIGAFRVLPAGRVRLHSVYADTSTLVLARAGIALRFRRIDDRKQKAGRWEATIKWIGRVDGDVHHRPEINIPLQQPPAFPLSLQEESLRLHLSAWLCGRKLVPLFVTDIVRQRRHLVNPIVEGGEILAELALDEVEIRATADSEAVARYCEIEIERVAGTVEDVATAGAVLKQELNLEAAPVTKFGRAMELLHPQVEFGVHSIPGFAPGDRSDIAASRIVAVQLRRLRESDPVARLGRDPEGVHGMRVAIRRMRTLTRSFVDSLPDGVAERLGAELEWLGDSLAPVREIDVELERLDRFAAQAPQALREALARLRQQLGEQRVKARVAMTAVLEGGRYRRLLLTLERISERRWRSRRPVPDVGSLSYDAVRRSFKTLRRCAKQEEVPGVETMHALRIRAKRLRYVLEFFADLAGKSAQRALDDLTDLQEVLGSYHDAMRATDHIQSYVAGADMSTDAAQVLALGALLGAQLQAAEEARRRFTKIWRRLRHGKRRRHLKQVLDRLKGLAPATEVGL